MKISSKVKNRIEKITIFILGIVFALCVNALADACTTTVDATNVTYDNTDVSSALNDLYAVNTGTATASRVLEGYTFSNDSSIGIEGTMTNRGAVSETVGVGESYTIPQGYHNGNGTVTGPTLDGDAGVSSVLSGKTFYSNSGTKKTGTMATLTSSNFTGTHSSTTAGAASNYTVKSTSGGYVANNTTVNTLAAATSPTIATTSASGTQTINIKPGYYNKISVNQNNAYNKGKSDGGASWVQVWSGSTTGNVSVSLSSYSYVVVQVTGGSWLILKVGGSAGYIGYIGTSPDGMWGTWGGTRGYQATTSGISGTTDLYGATENKGRSWISITKVWGIKNLN